MPQLGRPRLTKPLASCRADYLHWHAASPTGGGWGGSRSGGEGGLRGEQWGEEEETGNFVRFLRSSMGNKSSKDKAFIILLEALAHMVSLQLKQVTKPLASYRAN